MIVVVDLLKDVIEKVSDNLNTQLVALPNRNFTGIQFEYGKRLAIIEQLSQKTDAQMIKYPLIAVFQPFDENVTVGAGFYAEVTLSMAIVVDTGNTDKTDYRYENNFKPILYPIYEELLKQFRIFNYGKYKPFQVPVNGVVEHTKRDNPYWSNENNENPGIDFLDAIEIINMKLLLNTKNC